MVEVVNLDGSKKTYTQEDVVNFFNEVSEGYIVLNSKEKVVNRLIRKLERKKKLGITEFYDMFIEASQNALKREEYEWKYVSRNIFIKKIYAEAAFNRGYKVEDTYKTNFYEFIKYMVSIGKYNPELLKEYTEEEVNEVAKVLDPQMDFNFDYLGLYLLDLTYLNKGFNSERLELPQEKWLVGAMDLLRNENKDIQHFGKDNLFYKFVPNSLSSKKNKRIELIKEAYWAMSNLYLTPATPTTKALGTPKAQYSSCFIDTVEDSLRGIYDTNTELANVSKNGAGVGVYVGRIRPNGSDIRGIKDAASGIMGWLKGYENTAVTVNQLNQRQGSFSPQLPIYHPDIEAFLNMRKNTGTEEIRTFELFPCVLLNDLFMELAEDPKAEWHLFDPKEVHDKYGFYLDEFYDEVRGQADGEFRTKYQMLVNDKELQNTKVVNARNLYKKIIVDRHETGLPYVVFIDEMNRSNPNNHKGRILSTNLCTEIAQNMSSTSLIKEYIDPETLTKRAEWDPGDFVVCNLSSISLPRVLEDNVMDRVVKIQMRLLDNVIDLNNSPVEQATITMLRYRSVGAGVMGWSQELIRSNIDWQSDRALEYTEEVFDKWSYAVISAEVELAKEKGAYHYFEGSDWQTGKYFTRRGLVSDKWVNLQADVAKYGVRNGYMMAIAPTGSIAQINGSTEGINPNFGVFYVSSKKKYKIEQVVPGYNLTTALRYGRNNNGNAFLIDQSWSIKQNSIRQKYVDQAISFDYHIKPTTKFSEVEALDRLAWTSGMKSIYYTRSETLEAIEECEFCQ